MNVRFARSLLLAAVCGIVVTAALSAGADSDGDAAPGPRRGNVLTLRKPPPASATDHATTVAGFVRLASGRDVDAVFRSFDEVPVRVNGDAAIRHFVVSEVMPFFANAERIDASMLRVTAASFEDGTEGHMAYTYIVTASGQARPFVLAWRAPSDALRVMDVQLGRCVKARHPVGPGRCDAAP